MENICFTAARFHCLQLTMLRVRVMFRVKPERRLALFGGGVWELRATGRVSWRHSHWGDLQVDRSSQSRVGTLPKYYTTQPHPFPCKNPSIFRLNPKKRQISEWFYGTRIVTIHICVLRRIDFFTFFLFAECSVAEVRVWERAGAWDLCAWRPRGSVWAGKGVIVASAQNLPHHYRLATQAPHGGQVEQSRRCSRGLNVQTHL